MKSFSSRVIEWQQRKGRHSLPWQVDRDPYRIWLSEIMLQQTQVATVIPYFERFVKRFPSLHKLASAHEDDVLALWSGLGYYSRARNLHAAARCIVDNHGGQFPASPEILAQLPGIGRSTAAAIAALAFGRRCAILDGNVKRVLARHGGITGWPGNKQVEAQLWTLAESSLPASSIEAYTQGMMDLGALLCTRSQPACNSCPLNVDCIAHTRSQTAVLPTPRPKKALPERQVQMLLLIHQGELLLEKRPARGIWGGLWSLPELEYNADPAAHCQQFFGVDSLGQQPLARLAHGFTHFKLEIQATRLHPAARPRPQPGQMWLPVAGALDAALPAPVRKLIAMLET